MKRSAYIVAKTKSNTARVARSMSQKELGSNARKSVADRIRQMRKGKKC